ncbi:MAG: L-threonylcarbamoyladenylate synthase [Planctomycetaceae bacterium]
MRCRITRQTDAAVAVLKAGGVVALPTETVYGLGASTFDPQAVSRIFAAKQRPLFDPLIVHIAAQDWLPQVAADFPDQARKLAEKFWPGPLTIVLPKNPAVPDLVTSGLPTVGVRVPDHPVMQKVLQEFGKPIAAPSANLFGRLSPTTVEHVLEQLGDRIELVLDGGPCRVGVESTIVQFAGENGRILRPGGISQEELEAVIGPLTTTVKELSPAEPLAPGRLPCHYAPRTPIQITKKIPMSATPGEPRGVLLWHPRAVQGYAAVEILSYNSNLAEAALNFFPALHRLDAAGLSQILAEPFPEHGLGRTLNDRLHRASAAFPS